MREFKQKKENRKEILTQSFHQAIQSLSTQLGTTVSSWKWGNAHQLECKHPLGSVTLFKSIFNVFLHTAAVNRNNIPAVWWQVDLGVQALVANKRGLCHKSKVWAF